jgi:hypothetical protein
MLQRGFLVQATTGQVSGQAVILRTILTQDAQFLTNEGPKLWCSFEAAKWDRAQKRKLANWCMKWILTSSMFPST